MGELGIHSNGDTELQASMAAFFFPPPIFFFFPFFFFCCSYCHGALATLIMTTVRRGAPHPFLVLLLC